MPRAPGAMPAASGPAAGTHFGEALARFERELDLPYPERAELLDEMAADLEAAYAESRRRGLPEAEARAAALRALGPDGPALAALAELHRPAARRALERLVVLARAGEGLTPPEAVPVGLRESLSTAITALGLSTLSVLLHGAVAAGRRALCLPEAPPRS